MTKTMTNKVEQKVSNVHPNDFISLRFFYFSKLEGVRESFDHKVLIHCIKLSLLLLYLFQREIICFAL